MNVINRDGAMNLFVREKYLQKLRGFYHDTETIKAVTGIRC